VIRLKASLAHFILSACVVGLAMLVVFFIWYPSPYAYTNNILLIIQILVCVDIVLGPLLTFVVFNLKKPRKELKRDLAIIATVQVCALAYGLFTLYIQRPVVTAFAVDRFEVLGDYDVAQETTPEAAGKKPFRGPQYVFVRPARDRAEQSKLVEALIDDQLEMVAMTDRYLNVPANIDKIAERALSVEEIANAPLNKLLPDEVSRLRSFAKQHANGVMFQVLQGRQRSGVVAVDSKTGDFMEYFKLDPWAAATAVEQRLRQTRAASVSTSE